MIQSAQLGMWCVAITLLICSAFAIRYYRKSQDIFHPIVFWSAFYACFMGFGYVVQYFVVRSFQKRVHTDWIGFMILVGYLSFLVGFAAIPRRTQTITKVDGQPRILTIIKERILLLFFAAFVAGLLFYYFRGEIIYLGGTEMGRFEAVSGWGYVYQLMMGFSFVIPVLISSHWYFGRQPGNVELLLIAIALLFIGASLNRGPIIWLVFSMLFSYHYLVKRARIRALVWWAAVLVLFGAAVGIMRDLQDWSFPRLGNRILLESRIHVQNLSMHLVVADKMGPVGFQPLLMSLSILAPGPQPDFGTFIKEEIGLKTVPSITLIGEGYFSARLVGIVISFVALGALLSWTYSHFRRVTTLRSLMIYMFLLFAASSAINYGIAERINSTLINLVLAVVIIPKETVRRGDPLIMSGLEVSSHS